MQDKDQNFNVGFGETIHQLCYQITEQLGCHGFEQKEMQQTIHNILHFCFTICFIFWVINQFMGIAKHSI